MGRETGPKAFSRRDVLRRGGIAGGALLWTAPVVQTIGMTAAHAQAGTVADCPAGQTLQVLEGLVVYDVLTDSFHAAGGPELCGATGAGDGATLAPGFDTTVSVACLVPGSPTTDCTMLQFVFPADCEVLDATYKSGSSSFCETDTIVISPDGRTVTVTSTVTNRQGQPQGISHVGFQVRCESCVPTP